MSNNKKPIYDEQLVEKLASHIKAIIELLGEDPSREGLLKTPELLRMSRKIQYAY